MLLLTHDIEHASLNLESFRKVLNLHSLYLIKSKCSIVVIRKVREQVMVVTTWSPKQAFSCMEETRETTGKLGPWNKNRKRKKKSWPALLGLAEDGLSLSNRMAFVIWPQGWQVIQSSASRCFAQKWNDVKALVAPVYSTPAYQLAPTISSLVWQANLVVQPAKVSMLKKTHD